MWKIVPKRERMRIILGDDASEQGDRVLYCRQHIGGLRFVIAANARVKLPIGTALKLLRHRARHT